MTTHKTPTTSRMDADVVVVGAGPVGLWLAAELRLHDVSVLVLEKATTRDPRSRAVGMQAGTLDTFATRGLADRFIERGIPVPTGHFGAAGTRLDFRRVGAVHPFSLALSQYVTEQLLEEHAASRGAEVRRGQEVISLTQDDAAVELVVRADGGHTTLRARWVVGCDGTRSAVRQAAGIGFPGTDTTMTGWLADVALAEPPGPGDPLMVRGQAGVVLAAPLGDGMYRIAGLSNATKGHGVGAPLTLDEARERTRAVVGHDMGMHSPLWLSQYGNATRQATTYRSRRVLLAGDAAHMFFPAGGQGMNLGIQDAANLGWKLAATVRGRASDALLDTYDAERRPAGAAVMDNTRAQSALFGAETPEEVALRDAFSEALAHPETNLMWARRVAGFGDPRYTTCDRPDGTPAHPMAGTRLAGLALRSGADEVCTPHQLLHGGELVLLDLDGRHTPLASAMATRHDIAHHAAGVHRETSAEGWHDVTSVLIRPDARIAWAGTDHDPRRRAEEVAAVIGDLLERPGAA
ncbi:FAD-dependent monooxygenase [Streptantibioticus parmotrematis]|uniref:FAD-dependent monooxygenase n=1 Tax=Streptantibioticus parmotrematis TaxID=2873249 RepID=UPI00340A0DE2